MEKIIISLISSINLMSSFAYATDIDKIIGGGTAVIGPKPVATSFVNKLLGAFSWIGYAIAVGMLVFVGIKYVMSSADEKSELKTALVKYTIGAILIAGASTIAGWIFNTI